MAQRMLQRCRSSQGTAHPRTCPSSLVLWRALRLTAGMIRSELIARIAEQNLHLCGKDVEAVVTTIFDRMADALVAGDRVEIRGLGTLSLREQGARKARNPKTGQTVMVREKQSIAFKPSKVMKARLNPSTVVRQLRHGQTG